MLAIARKQTIACAAVVALLALCAGAFVLMDDDAEQVRFASEPGGYGLAFEPIYGSNVSYSEYDETFEIHMRVGDVFTYTPETNFDEAVISYSGNTTGLSWNDDTTLSGSFEAAGEYAGVLSATVDHGTVSQHAYQRVNFVVYDRIEFAGAEGPGDVVYDYAYAPGDLSDGRAVHRVALASGLDTPQITYSFEVVEGKTGVFSWDDTTKTIVADKVLESADEGNYVLKVTASYSYEGGQDSASVTVNVTVKEGVAITSPGTFDVTLGDEDAKYRITTNKDIELDYEMTVQSGYEGILILQDGVITVDMEKAEQILGDAEEFTFTAHVTVTEVGDDTNTDTKDVTVTVSERPWTAAPVIDADSVLVEPIGGDATNIRVTVTVEHADSVVFAWGDGSVDDVNGVENVYTADHPYASTVKNPVVIAVSAENAHGDVIGYILYDLTSGEATWSEDRPDVPSTGDDATENDGFLADHGILWIVFAIAAIILALVFLFGVQNQYILIGVVILALLAVAAFVTNDFGLELMR